MATDRRRFLQKSLGAAPIVLTVINRRGFGGNSVHGTLWSSGGTDWKHRRKWWRGEDWDKWDEAPRFRTHESEQGGREGESPAQTDWDWRSPGEDWRKWRPEGDEIQKSDWQWRLEQSRDAAPRDVPAAPIEETTRAKE
jgi:hypothetical protein